MLILVRKVNNNRIKFFKICFSGNEKPGINSKMDIYFNLVELTSLISDEAPRLEKLYSLLRELNLLVMSVYEK